MKRWIVTFAVVAVLAVAAFLIAQHFSERRRQAGNARDSAEWFATSLKIGNERAASNYLARTTMDAAALEHALLVCAPSLLTTNFNTAPVQLHQEQSRVFATFACADGVTLTFYTEDGGDVWRVHSLKPK